MHRLAEFRLQTYPADKWRAVTKGLWIQLSYFHWPLVSSHEPVTAEAERISIIFCVSPDVRFIYALISSPGSNSLGKRAADGQTKPPDSLVLVGNSVDSMRLLLKPRTHHSIHGNQPPHDASCASLNSEMRFPFRVIQSCGCFPFIVKLIGLCVFSLAVSASCVMGADAWHMHLYNQCSFSGLPCLMV